MGLNMLSTASTDSRVIPLSQPGGAKLCQNSEKQAAHGWPDPAGGGGSIVFYLRQDPSKLVVGYPHHDRNLQNLIFLEEFFSCVRQKVPIHHSSQENLHLPPPRQRRLRNRHPSRLGGGGKKTHNCKWGGPQKSTFLVTWMSSSFLLPFTHRIISSVLLWSHPVRLAMIWSQKTN